MRRTDRPLQTSRRNNGSRAQIRTLSPSLCDRRTARRCCPVHAQHGRTGAHGRCWYSILLFAHTLEFGAQRRHGLDRRRVGAIFRAVHGDDAAWVEGEGAVFQAGSVSRWEAAVRLPCGGELLIARRGPSSSQQQVVSEKLAFLYA